MCLAIPGKIIEIKEDLAIVDYGNLQLTVKPVIKIKIGDFVLVQNKMIVEIIDKTQAEKFLESLND
jgi:hydrogenase expression/formation protein HypC